MKKLLVLVLTALIGFSIIGCSKHESKKSELKQVITAPQENRLSQEQSSNPAPEKKSTSVESTSIQQNEAKSSGTKKTAVISEAEVAQLLVELDNIINDLGTLDVPEDQSVNLEL